MATVYAVASAKGGVGKTTTAAAVATVLSSAGADVVAVDADIGMANLAGVLGIDVGDTTIHDVLAGDAAPNDAVHDGPAGLRVVPGETDLDAYAAADPAAFGTVIDAFDDADYVIVDGGAGLSHDSSMPLALADETLLVSTPERGALGDTEKTRQLTERLGGTVAGAALTRLDPTDTPDELVADILQTTVLGRIPEDPFVSRADRAGKPLVTFAPMAPATVAYRDLARALTGIDVPDPERAGDTTPDRLVADEAEPATPDEAEPATPDEAEPATPDEPEPATPDEPEPATPDESETQTETTSETVDTTEEFDDQSAPDASADGIVMTDAAPTADDEEQVVITPDADIDDDVDGTDDTAASDDGVDDGEVDDADDEPTSESADVEPLVSEAEPDRTESAPDSTSSDADDSDSYAGSVPFRDADDGATVGSAVDDAEADSDDEGEQPSATPAGSDSEAEADSADDSRSRGFFSRLFRR